MVGDEIKLVAKKKQSDERLENAKKHGRLASSWAGNRFVE